MQQRNGKDAVFSTAHVPENVHCIALIYPLRMSSYIHYIRASSILPKTNDHMTISKELELLYIGISSQYRVSSSKNYIERFSDQESLTGIRSDGPIVNHH